MGHTCRCRPGLKQETGNRKKKPGEANRHLRNEQTLVSDWRTTEKEKTSPHRWRFISNCIVFKVQEFMYRNTAVLSSAPQRKQEGEQRKGTNPGEQSEQKQNTEIKENIKNSEEEQQGGLLLTQSRRKTPRFREALGKQKRFRRQFPQEENLHPVVLRFPQQQRRWRTLWSCWTGAGGRTEKVGSGSQLLNIPHQLIRGAQDERSSPHRCA